MRLTEAEARTKWCPLARMAFFNKVEAPAVNRDVNGAPHQGCQCIASECMAGWRWIDAPGSGGVATAADGTSSYSERRGYCGIGGWARF